MKTRGTISILLAVLVVLSLVLSSFLSGCSSQTTTTQSSTTKPAVSGPASSAPAASSVAPAAGVKVLKFAYDMTPVSAIVAGWTVFASELEKRTNGRYKVDFFPSGTLIKRAETLNGLAQGIADISPCNLSSQQQVFPIGVVASLPSVAFPDTAAGHKAYQDTAREFYAKFPAIVAEYKQFKVLFRHPLPSYMPIAKKTRLVLPADLKGLKVACEGENMNIASLAGGTPVSMGLPDVYQALDKGVVDATMCSWFHLVSQHFEEVASNYLDYSLTGQGAQYVMMNGTSWNSLPPDVQKIIMDLAPAVEAASTDSYLTQIKQGRELAKAKNVTVTVPNAEQKKAWADLVKPLDQMWLDKMKTQNVTDAPAMLDFLKQRAADAWSKNQ